MSERTFGSELFANEKFAPLEPTAQVLFMSMVANANDWGEVKGTAVEFKMMTWPWGHVPLATVQESLAALLSVELVVAYADDYFFIPGWWSHQGWKKFMRASKYPAPSRAILDKYPRYRDGRMLKGADRKQAMKNAQLQRAKNSLPPKIDDTSAEAVAEALKIQAISERDERCAIIVHALREMATAKGHGLKADEVDLYIQDLEELSPDVIQATCRQLRKERPYMCRSDIIIARAREIFGKTDTKDMKRAENADKLMEGLIKGRGIFEIVYNSIRGEKTRALAEMDVWDRLEQVFGESPTVALHEIYGDTEFHWRRLQSVWAYMTKRAADREAAEGGAQ